MSKLQRIKDIAIGVFMIIYAVALLIVPEDAYDTVAALISLLMMAYGVKLLYYYFTMARHMVGGKSILYQAIIVLDAALFTGAMVSMESFVIIAYLFGIYAFTGAVDILRSIEAKNNGARSWKLKFVTGAVTVIFALVMVVLALIFKNTMILVYGYCISLTYSGVMRIVSACRKTAMVYIQ